MRRESEGRFCARLKAPLLAKGARNGAPRCGPPAGGSLFFLIPPVNWRAIVRGPSGTNVLLVRLVRLVRVRFLRDSPGLCRPGWLWLGDWGVGDLAGARLRGIFRGASFLLCGGGRSG